MIHLDLSLSISSYFSISLGIQSKIMSYLGDWPQGTGCRGEKCIARYIRSISFKGHVAKMCDVRHVL
jgi:hypothetical protein